MPADTDSRRLSVSSCRTTRHRPAPSERRTAISRRRAIAPPTSRPLTFVQVMSRMSKVTEPNRSTT